MRKKWPYVCYNPKNVASAKPAEAFWEENAASKIEFRSA